MFPTKENTDKVVLLDFSVYIHKAIFALKFNPDVPATYTALSMILSTLTKVGVTPDSLIIFCCDGRASWRKEIESAYKGTRKAHREDSGIDFNHWFEKFNELREFLDENTNWIFAGPINHIEADDIIAASCRFYKDIPEIVICSHDHDLEQCWAIHEGAKIFSLQTKKWKIKPNNYNVYAEIAKMVKKEASDNLITEVTTQEELDNRLMCVDLTKLPEWVEQTIVDTLSDPELYSKNICPELLPNSKRAKEGERPKLQDRLDNLYNDTSKIMSYEKQVADKIKKEERAKEKKRKEKEKAKRAKEREKKRLLKEKKLKSKEKK